MKGKTVKRLAAFAVALAMIGSSLSAELGGIGLIDGFSLTASAAQEAVSYTVYSWNNSTKTLSETTKTITDYKVVTKDIIKNSEDGNGILSGTYVVTQNTTVEDYLYIRKGCTANIVVPKGVTLTCKQGIGCGYDKNKAYATLNIYGGGKIVANGMKYAAGIGGKDDETNGNITIHGTEIEATGGKHGAGIGGGEGGQDPDASSPTITIYAGKITANGGMDGAGIGGGDEQPGARTYIYGGDITASSEKHGAGIGGGDEEGTFGIHIYDGKITATGGEGGAGIGAGEEGGNLRKKDDGGGINIYGGEIVPTVERSAGYENRGIKTTVYGGTFSIVPFNNDYDRFNLAEGRMAVCTNYSRTAVGSSYTFHYKVTLEDGCDLVASLSSGVYAEKLGESFAAGVAGDVVTLLKDCTETVRTEIKRDVVFDLGGYTLTGDNVHVLSIPNSNSGISAVVSNGTIVATGNNACVLTYQNADVTLGKGLTLRGAYACFFNGINGSVSIDGASVETTTMCNFYTVGNASFVVRGDSVVNVTKFKALNTQDDSFAVAEGGLWNLDPAGYVTNNFVKLHRSGAATYKYQVVPWEDICTEGWTFRVGDEAPVVSGTCYTPLAPIAVRSPERKTLVADFSGLVLSSPSDSLSFESAPGLEKSLALTYEDSKLYASLLRGFTILFR